MISPTPVSFSRPISSSHSVAPPGGVGMARLPAYPPQAVTRLPCEYHDRMMGGTLRFFGS